MTNATQHGLLPALKECIKELEAQHSALHSAYATGDHSGAYFRAISKRIESRLDAARRAVRDAEESLGGIRLVVSITMENDAFSVCNGDEASRILHKLSVKLAGGHYERPISWVLLDINGNAVGEAEIVQ